MELLRHLPANDIRLSAALRAHPVLATWMTSSAVDRVVWQRGSMDKLWQEMTENAGETFSVKRKSSVLVPTLATM